MSSQFVPGVGPPNAKIVIVGEAPGEEETRLGQPFIGPSGKVLNQMLARVGIDRNACYVTNVVKTRPPGNDFGVFYEDPAPKQRFIRSAYLQGSIKELHEEIARISPNVIIAAGGESLRALTNLRGIDKWRGSILRSAVGKCVPCYHPTRILRVWEERPICEADLRRANVESRSHHIDLPAEDFELFPEFGSAMDFLRRRPRRIAIDIETVGSGLAKTRCIGIADSATHAMCIPLMATPRVFRPGDQTFIEMEPAHSLELNSYWTLEQEHAILLEMSRLFRDQSVEKVLQNYPFDSTILAQEFGLDIHNLHMDTLLAQHTCFPELPKGLDFLASIYTRRPYYSDYDNSVDEQVFKYNCLDCVCTLESSDRLDIELKSLGLTEFYENHVHPTLLAITRAQNRGVCIDIAKRAEHATRVEAELEVAKQKLHAICGFDLNPNSHKQMHKLLYDTLGIPPYYHHKTKEITADEDTIERIMLKYPEHMPMLTEVLEYRKTSKLLGAFLKNELRVGPDGVSRFFTAYNVGGTKTGRLTSSKTLFGDGGNLQQFPRGRLREIFIAELDWLLSKKDLSQAEFRYVVWKARIFRIIQQYLTNPNFDAHRWNAAANLYHIPESAVTKEQRSNAKNGIYGGQYGMYYRRAAIVYSMDVNTAKHVLDALHRGLPEIKDNYWGFIQQQFNTRRMIENELGRKRLAFGRAGDDTYRQLYSGLAQSMIADLINRAFHLMDEIYDETEAHPLMQVHDEIVGQIKKGFEDKYLPIEKRLMEYPLQIEGVDAPLIIPAEIGLGPNWYEQKEVKL